MSAAYVFGYDPGGNGRHGVAALRVEQRDGRWEPVDLVVTTERDIAAVVEWLENACRGGRIVAAGVDTLTEWNSGRNGDRPADTWLRKACPDVRGGIITPAGLYGAMVIGGAGFLLLLQERFRADGTMVTEAHPKVCYRVLTGRKADWKTDREQMADWLLRELGVGVREEICIAADHRFDAAVAALAALRGLNGVWTLDLHALPDSDLSKRIRFCGPTHYWWPTPSED